MITFVIFFIMLLGAALILLLTGEPKHTPKRTAKKAKKAKSKRRK